VKNWSLNQFLLELFLIFLNSKSTLNLRHLSLKLFNSNNVKLDNMILEARSFIINPLNHGDTETQGQEANYFNFRLAQVWAVMWACLLDSI
jgi:hypothetical protein